MTVMTDYIAIHPHQAELTAVYQCLRAALPAAEERLSYGMPTFWQGENLIHFAPAKRHLGIYPTPSAIVAFAEPIAELGLTTTKGSLHLPYDRPLPLALLTAIAEFRLAAAKK